MFGLNFTKLSIVMNVVLKVFNKQKDGKKTQLMEFKFIKDYN
jgi:hypothetical protein